MPDPVEEKIAKPLKILQSPVKLILGVAVTAVVLGVITGYVLSTKSEDFGASPLSIGEAKTAQQDAKTFRDFAEGTIKLRPEPTDPQGYAEGTHILERENAVPVALTSSVVDLSQYEGKKVKVYGETQKALKEGWLMDVGRVDEI